jgi:hypothetical protein
MAIKGKGRTKTRQVARAPRREPIKVKTPFFTRRWVQLAGAALAGAAVILLSFWVFNGLTKDHKATTTAAQARSKLQAADKWRALVQSSLAGISTQNQGAPPSMLPDASAVTVALSKGQKLSASAQAVLDKASLQAKKTAAALEAFDIAGTISGKGFSADAAQAFIDSKYDMVQALGLYSQSADLSVKALQATGAERKDLAKMAVTLRASADSLFGQGWNAYSNAMNAAGINLMVPTGGQGLPATTP